MIIANPLATSVCNEVEKMLSILPFDHARVLELGCGRAEKTRQLAESGRPAHIVALEVDAVQHARNQAISDLPMVSFQQGGAEAIPAADSEFDIVILLKSLHHVPLAHLDQALAEVARVLRPGGWAWISEPVFAGELNEVMRLFHDEQLVRQAAFNAVRQVVDTGRLALEEQLFFLTRSHFDDFDHFDRRMIQVTHTRHALSPALYAQVKARFETSLGPGGATFLSPQRVDILRKRAAP